MLLFNHYIVFRSLSRLNVPLLQAVRPENVVVEVCRSRTAVMYDEEPQPGRSGPAAESNSMSLR